MGDSMRGASGPLVRVGAALWLPLLCLALFPAVAASAQNGPEEIFISRSHRFVPDTNAGDENTVRTGQALCGTRCNALSATFESYQSSPGWRMIQGRMDKEITVELDNPFIKGKCVCTGEEYRAELYYYLPTETSPDGAPRDKRADAKIPLPTPKRQRQGINGDKQD